MNLGKNLFSFRKNPKNPELPDKIHYGCGKTIIPGWLNVDAFDLSSYPGGTIDTEIAKHIQAVNLTLNHPFPDSRFKFGFSEDFIEHLDQAESLIFLCECFRTFAVGGVLRLSFPDLKNVLKKHYTTPTYERAVEARKEAYTMWTHKHFYCYESLSLVAKHLGFRKIMSVEFGKSAHAALRNLEKRYDQIDLNLIVEITK